MMQHDPRLRAAARAIYDACYPSEEWSLFPFDEAERYGTVHYEMKGKHHRTDTGISHQPRRALALLSEVITKACEWSGREDSNLRPLPPEGNPCLEKCGTRCGMACG